MVEALDEEQKVSSLVEEQDNDITPLIDILGNRGNKVYRIAPMASDVPERSVQRVAAAADATNENWVHEWKRPVRLLHKPDLIEVMALLPDHPPVWFSWRGNRRRVKFADGPERVFGEWWIRSSELVAVRDYFVVEDEVGERFWIYRSGDGVDIATGSHKWFIHGIFA